MQPIPTTKPTTVDNNAAVDNWVIKSDQCQNDLILKRASVVGLAILGLGILAGSVTVSAFMLKSRNLDVVAGGAILLPYAIIGGVAASVGLPCIGHAFDWRDYSDPNEANRRSRELMNMRFDDFLYGKFPDLSLDVKYGFVSATSRNVMEAYYNDIKRIRENVTQIRNKEPTSFDLVYNNRSLLEQTQYKSLQTCFDQVDRADRLYSEMMNYWNDNVVKNLPFPDTTVKYVRV